MFIVRRFFIIEAASDRSYDMYMALLLSLDALWYDNTSHDKSSIVSVQSYIAF